MEFYDMQRTIDGIERQRLLTNWLLKCTPHMATPSRISDCRPTAAAQATAVTAAAAANTLGTIAANPEATIEGNYNSQHSSINKCGPVKVNRKYGGSKDGGNVVMNAMNILKVRNKGAGVQVVHQPVKNRLKFLTKSKPTGSGPYITIGTNVNTHIQRHHGLHSAGENRRAKLRRFISHVSNTNTFSVADFENARLARRNEIELKQRLQRCNGKASITKNNDWLKIRITEGGGGGTSANTTLEDVSSNNNNNNVLKHNHEIPNVRLYIEEFLEQYNLPRIVRIFYNSKLPKKCSIYRSENGPQTIISGRSKTKTMTAAPASINPITNPDNTNMRCVSSMQTMGSSTSSSNNSSNVTKASNSCLNGSHSNDSNNNHGTDDEEQGEVLLLYRMVQHRHIYHAYNAKTTASNRKKGILIPQEFPGYFSQLNSKGVPTATQYTSVIQLVRERVCKFISLDNMPAFTECHFNDNDRSGNIASNVPKGNYTTTNHRPQYTKTTAKGGQVFKLLAVYEDDKQDQNSLGVTISCVSLGNSKQYSSNGREKDRCRYAQLLNEQRQTIYVSLATKGKFYEVEPGIPQLFQKHLANEGLNKINLDCVHRITALINSKEKLPITLRYISGPANCTNLIPDNISIYHITTEDVIISCPIENVEMQTPLYLLKLHINSGLQLMKTNLGFESEQRMLANHNVQNILKFCQFNCDQFLRVIEVENLNPSPTSNSNGKSRKEGLKILKPLQISNLLRREKSQMLPTHEKEDSIIFLTKSHLANLVNNKKTNFDQHTNRLTNKMRVFQSSRRNWFRKQQDPKVFNCLDDITLGIQAKRMSIERYTDMSKLMQERFGDKLNSIDSNVGNSNTRRNTYEETSDSTKFNTNSSTIPKSISLQDIDSTTNSFRMDTNTSSAASGIAAIANHQQAQQNSFITEKLYNEFHVKTRQYSKSFTNVNQLLNFSPPQKLNINENKVNRNAINRQEVLKEAVENGSGTADCLSSITSSLIDDLPYSNVRDSLIVSSGDSSSLDIPATSNLFQTLHLIDYTKENIYAEICHDVGNTNASTNGDAAVTITTNHSPINDLADECGEYATLLYPDANGLIEVSGSNPNNECCSSDASHLSRPSAITTSVIQHAVQLPIKHTTANRFTNGVVKAESSGHITRVNVVDTSRKNDANK